jgi:hypothetical protein
MIHLFTHPANDCIAMLKLVKKLLYEPAKSKKVEKKIRNPQKQIIQ